MRTELTIGLALIVLGLAPPSSGDALQESATLGPVGQTGGWALADSQFLGARFLVEETTEIAQVGAHLHGSGRLFAAIVRLDGDGALPAGAPFGGDEIVAHTTFVPPQPSADLLVDLSATLEPGHYALVLGSGQFGASGAGAMARIGQKDLFSASYLGWIDGGWRDAETLGSRFRVLGATACVADIDASDDVGMSDLLVLLSGWGPCPKDCPGDLNDDAVVDFEDLLILLGAWGPCA